MVTLEAMRTLKVPIVVAATTAMALCGCVSAVDDPVGDRDTLGLDLGPGLSIEVIHEDLIGPTQFVVGQDGTLTVAVINGGENDRQGQVVRIDPASGATEVVRSDLDKPTGLAVLGSDLWVMERDRLTRTGIDGIPVVVADDLPNNGRSEGTLTVTPDGLILFNTSGSKRGADVVDGSGRLFTVDPSSRAGEPVEIASGFKNAYGHVFDDNDVLWSTEMSDGRFDGSTAADELVAVSPGQDHGWPRCVGNNRPVVEFGGSEELCAEVPPSAAVFAPGATPTSVAVSPFGSDQLVVALWNEGRIVTVDLVAEAAGQNQDDGGGVATVIAGLSGPQHLVAVGDALYVSEFGRGRILRITADG